jgi:hypothetical protein
LRALSVALAFGAAATAHAQNVTVIAANASNDSIYSVVFNKSGGGTTTNLNTDQGTLHNLVSLAFYTNPATFQLDLLAADNGGQIVRYPGDFGPGNPTSGIPVFTAGGSGPTNPDALSVDAAGNLFLVNSKPGTTSNPQLWVFPADGSGGFGSPVLIDSNYGSKLVLQETLVVATTITPPGGAQPVLYPGDLLVLTSNPAQVLRYPGSNGAGPAGPTIPTPLITLPAGTVPGGLAFWPADNSLLITTSRGTIFQYTLTPNEQPANFALGLGNGQFKIKTGVQLGVPYAYVANNNGGDILQFGGVNQLLATVTRGVQHPQGLAVTNTAYAPVTTCQNQQTSGCDILGGKVVTHELPPTLSITGNIIENVCIVPVDPRLVKPGSVCTTSLPVASVCAGFSDSILIPPSLCGASGPTGKGFALVKTRTQAEAVPNAFPFNGTLVFNDSELANLLPSPGNPVCNPPAPGTTPLATFTWAPLAGEGAGLENNNLLELTSGCDGATSKAYGMSLYGVGLALNTAATGPLPVFAAGKYATLVATLQTEISENALSGPVPPSTSPPNGNFTYQLQQCVSTSQAAFNKSASYYGGAALELLTADQNVAAVAAQAPPFTPDSDFPNPSGAIRARLQNLYYTLNTRIGGNPASSGPPSPPPPPPPPSISGTPATTAKAGNVYTFKPGAADFAGNKGTLSFSIAGKPSWATFDATTGQLSGVAVKGTYPGITISVSDGCAGASLPAFSIKVN